MNITHDGINLDDYASQEEQLLLPSKNALDELDAAGRQLQSWLLVAGIALALLMVL